MNLIRTLAGAALVFGLSRLAAPVLAQDSGPAIDQSLPVPPPGLGELSEVIALTNRTSHLKQQVRALAEAPYFCIRVHVEPTDLEDTKIKISDILLWTQEELARSAPNARILGPEEQAENANRVYPKARSAMDFLQRTDGSSRFLEIKLNLKANRNPAAKDSLVCIAGANFWRPAIQPAGFFFHISDMQLTTGIVPGNDHGKIKDMVQASVRKFATKWSLANKPVSPPAPSSPSFPPPSARHGRHG